MSYDIYDNVSSFKGSINGFTGNSLVIKNFINQIRLYNPLQIKTRERYFDNLSLPGLNFPFFDLNDDFYNHFAVVDLYLNSHSNFIEYDSQIGDVDFDVTSEMNFNTGVRFLVPEEEFECNSGQTYNVYGSANEFVIFDDDNLITSVSVSGFNYKKVGKLHYFIKTTGSTHTVTLNLSVANNKFYVLTFNRSIKFDN